MFDERDRRALPVAVDQPVDDGLAYGTWRKLSHLPDDEAAAHVPDLVREVCSILHPRELLEDRTPGISDPAQRVASGSRPADVVQRRLRTTDQQEGSRLGEEPLARDGIETPKHVEVRRASQLGGMLLPGAKEVLPHQGQHLGWHLVRANPR